MNTVERQQVLDLVDLQINRYFDHYLTDVFPAQLDRMFAAHNTDTEAHGTHFKVLSATAARVNRWTWMLAGMATLLSLALTAGALFGYLVRPN